MPEADTKAAPAEQGALSEEQLREQVRRNKQRRDAQEKGEDLAQGPDLITASAKGEDLSAEEQMDALEWFMSDDPSDFTHPIELNVGTPKKPDGSGGPKWITWEIRPVDLDTLKRIRKASQGGSRAQQRRSQATGEIDEVEANIQIVIEGTVYPDLRQIANDKRLVDPGDALKRQFVHKPGLLGQLAGEIMSISGYDDEDVREVEAAKNS